MTSLEGRARRLGDDVNTDYIISSTRKRDTIHAHVLKEWLLESLDRAFAASVRTGDVIVAGRNFGCGSAMEVAATVILAAGIRAVIATSYSRTFFRNAINNGLIPVQCDTDGFDEGDRLSVRFDGADISVANHTKQMTRAAAPISGITLAILNAGGLVPYLREHRRLSEERR
jgi:3-isopropylmalate/(R)-2-methylmalate dehydratase small subunit